MQYHQRKEWCREPKCQEEIVEFSGGPTMQLSREGFDVCGYQNILFSSYIIHRLMTSADFTEQRILLLPSTPKTGFSFLNLIQICVFPCQVVNEVFGVQRLSNLGQQQVV